jgi:hypothetical protein
MAAIEIAEPLRKVGFFFNASRVIREYVLKVRLTIHTHDMEAVEEYMATSM